MSFFQALLFDCDGVLLDSEPLVCAALAQAITGAGVAIDAPEAMRLFAGNSDRACHGWLEARGLDPHGVLADADRTLFGMFERQVPVMPGIERVVQGFAARMAVCSNSHPDRLARSLGRTSLAAWFGPHVYSGDQVAAPKPAPDLAMFAATRLGVAPERAIFIDDNHHGIRCGRAAGCMTVGFVGPSDTRAHHGQALRAAGADHVVHGADGLYSLLERLGVPPRLPSVARSA